MANSEDAVFSAISALLERAATDPGFRRACLQDPAAALARLGLSTPGVSLEYRFDEEMDTHSVSVEGGEADGITYVLTPDGVQVEGTGDEIPESELLSVAGGYYTKDKPQIGGTSTLGACAPTPTKAADGKYTQSYCLDRGYVWYGKQFNCQNGADGDCRLPA